MLLDIKPTSRASTVTSDPPPYSTGSEKPEYIESSESSSESNLKKDAISFGPVQHVRGLNTVTKYKNITGTYSIDPILATLPIRIPCRAKARAHAKKQAAPDASFFTKHGLVTLNLSTSGTGNPANVTVGSRTGDIVITLFDEQPTRHINLSINSRKGNITLLVSPTFSGAVHLYTKRGTLTFLPAFAKQMRMLKKDDGDALVLFGSATETSIAPSTGSLTADYCNLSSCRGSVTVGLAGEDKYVSEAGFWKKLGGYFVGGNLKEASGSSGSSGSSGEKEK